METKEYVLLKEYSGRKIGDKLYIDAYGLLSFKDDQETFVYFDNPIPDLLEQGWIKEVLKPLESWASIYKDKNNNEFVASFFPNKEIAECLIASHIDKPYYVRTSKFIEVLDEKTK
jgi:hypothetical protein